jgi:cyanophycin synthetase
LTDPCVDFAVLECARGGILRAGLGFNNCDISVITNISEDHLGMEEIDTLKEMTNVKAVVARSTFDDGYAILNADDKYVMSIKKELDCNIALFSMKADNQYVLEHCAKGGLAAILENNDLVICKGMEKIKVDDIRNIPLTFEGKAECMIKNIFPAVLVSVIREIPVETLQQALLEFIPSPETTPGRLNIFDFNKYQVMVDYAHNAGGFEELKTFMEQTPSAYKIGIVAGTGDRREEDLKNVGRFAAEVFDKIILKSDKNLRGNTTENINRCIEEGIREVKGIADVLIIHDEIHALQYAMEHAPEGSFITILADNIPRVLGYLKQHTVKNHATKEMPDLTEMAQAS